MKSGIRILLLIQFVTVVINTSEESCESSEPTSGVPADLNVKKSEVSQNMTLEECIKLCCKNETCQIAAFIKERCVIGVCKSSPCHTRGIEDENDTTAQFVILTRIPVVEEKTPEPATETNTESVVKPKVGNADEGSDDSVVKPKVGNAEEGSDESVIKPKVGNTEEGSDDEVTSCDPACGKNEHCNKIKECECNQGYTTVDSACTKTVVCTRKSCPGPHNACTVTDNQISCNCAKGYKLDEAQHSCIEVSCENVTCPEHAACAIKEANHHCFCNKGYLAQGVYCREEVTCTVEPQNTGCPEQELCTQVNDKLQCSCVPGKVRASPGGDCTGNATSITLTTLDQSVTLPQDSAQLSVSVAPAHSAVPSYYTYKWEQEDSPAEGGGSGIQGLTTNTITINKLVAGEYGFAVTVVGNKNEFQTQLVKLEVLPEQKENKPPVAAIQPAGPLSYKLPADFSLNGINSKDDDKIVSYKWTISGKPIASNDHVKLTGDNSDTLQVKVDAGEGNFTFKLVVMDKDGLTGEASKTVKILAEDDFPPSAKVSAPQTLTLPANSAVLYGNESTDDHGIVRWEWQKAEGSPKTGDMVGTTTSQLTLNNLVEGTYIFSLTVYDQKDHNSTASTTVTVRPAQIGPPIANAGENKEIVAPDQMTVLDGSHSTSPLGDLEFHWELVSGGRVSLSNGNTSKVTVTGLQIGSYRFLLTVTDKKNKTDTDEVTITVKEDDNNPPKAVLGSDIVLYVPNTAINIDGSNSTDDNQIARWHWTRSGASPALGKVVGDSATSPILKLCDLVLGEYNFTLTVYDEKDLSDSASVKVTVLNNPHANDIVQVYLNEDPANFTQERLESLTNILKIPFSDGKEVSRSAKSWDLVTMTVSTIDNKVVVYYYGKDTNNHIIPGAPLVETLRNTVYGRVLGFDFDMIDTTICSNTCSGHGVCEDTTRTCRCEQFWMENFFRASAGRQFSNCEWSKIYFGIILSLLILVFLCVMYTVWYILTLRNKELRRRKKYKILEEETGRGISLNDSSEDEDNFFKLKTRKSFSKVKPVPQPQANVLNKNNGFKSDKKK